MEIKPKLLLFVCLICSILSFAGTLGVVIYTSHATIYNIIVLALDILLFTLSIYGFYQEKGSSDR